MENVWYLFAGFFVTWLILGIYLFSLRRQIEVLGSELASLRGEARTSERQQSPESATASEPNVS
ncbi:CcmD family protein [Thermomicrobium sp.]|jgi:CcmD family protein|uniref:CcmD family protein n=1 Tax=Thermomicrobium sp. TaxID=1969469 RepID=UPI001B1EDFA3|nr:CcmD family protein [Thermomicrobium sp.]MBO9305682.1 CcmD family protein [Thermomicrobium sp.]MBO9350908.1 CcmD family protein [Thermomicrobium sp.]